MSCEHCKIAIDNSLKKLNGLIDVDINLIRKTVTINFNENTINLNKIITTIHEQGYNVLNSNN